MPSTATRWIVATCLPFAAALLAGPARADIDNTPPPPACEPKAVARWYRAVGSDKECVACTASVDDEKGCSGWLEPRDYRYHCRGSGQLSWSEVWCRDVDPSRAEPAPAPGAAAQPTARRIAPELAGHVKLVTASTTMRASAGYKFVPAQAIDGRFETSWQPVSSPAGGIGEWLQLDFDTDLLLTGVAVANGFQVEDKFGDEFLLNNRIKSATVSFSDGSTEKLEFGVRQRGYVELTFKPRRTRGLRLLVAAIYPGFRWNDLAVSDLVITGTVPPPEPEGGLDGYLGAWGHSAAKGALSQVLLLERGPDGTLRGELVFMKADPAGKRVPARRYPLSGAVIAGRQLQAKVVQAGPAGPGPEARVLGSFAGGGVPASVELTVMADSLGAFEGIAPGTLYSQATYSLERLKEVPAGLAK